MTITNSTKNYRLKQIKEIMYCNFIINKKEFLLMTSPELEKLINQKLINESTRAFVINKNFLSETDDQIKTSIKYIEDQSELEEISKDNLRVRIFEELENTNATITLDSELRHLELVIKGEGYLEEIKDCAYEDPESFNTFFENMINFTTKSQKINYQINSESYGKTLYKYAIVDTNKGGSSIDLINEKIEDYIEDFQYL